MLQHSRSPYILPSADFRRGERGAATLEATILFPILLILISACVQAGVYFYTRSLAMASAQEGVRVTATNQGTVTAGVDRASAFLRRTGRSIVETSQITGSRSTTTSTITVRCGVLSLIPGWTFSITETSTLPTERFTR